MKKILLFILMHVVFLVQSSSLPNCPAEQKILPKIEIPNNHFLNILIQDFTNPVKYGSQKKIYTVTSGNYENGVLIMVEAIYQDSICIDKAVGYTISNDNIVIFTSLAREFDLKTTNKTKDSITIKNAEKQKVAWTYYYYILGDIYARYSPEAGWLWSDGKPDE